MIDEAAGGPALQVLVDIGRPVNPAVLVGIGGELLAGLAQNRLHIQVVFHKHKNEPDHDDESRRLQEERVIKPFTSYN